MTRLWVIAPVYNEAKSLETFVDEWIEVLRASVGNDFVFCLLNDGSRDESLGVIRRLAVRYPELMVIDKENTGHGPTCLVGYQQAVEAGAEWIFQIDSDGQCDPADFDVFWQARLAGPLHYGQRLKREDGWIRRFVSRILTLFLFLLSFHWVRDANVPFRLMRRETLKEALKKIPPRFRLANVLLSLLHSVHPDMTWHPIRFRKRSGRQMPVKVSFFIREMRFFFRDYLSWTRKEKTAGFREYSMILGRGLLFLAAVYYILAFIVQAMIRLPIPVGLNWLEDVHMVQVHRLLTGHALYTEPSLDYTPVLYGPLYAYLSSVPAFFIGESYVVLRSVSIAATLGTQWIIGMLVWKMTKSKFAAWLAAGLYAGMYAATAFAFDLGRVDSLCLFFTMAMVYFIWTVQENKNHAVLLAPTAAVLAVLTKQTSLVPVALLSAWGFLMSGKRIRITAVLCIVSVFLSQIVPLLSGNRWFLFYLYQMPMAHPFLSTNIHDFLRNELLMKLSAGLVLCLTAFFVMFRQKMDWRKTFFILLFFLAMMTSGLLPRFKVGGGANNLMPICAAIAVCCGLIAGIVRNDKGWLTGVAFLLFLALFVQNFTSPLKFIRPKRLEQMKQMKQAEIDLFRSFADPVFAPCHTYLLIVLGKNESAFIGALYDVSLTSGEEGNALRRKMKTVFEEKYFSAVILPDVSFIQDLFPCYDVLEMNYQRVDKTNTAMPEVIKASFLRVYIPKTERRRLVSPGTNYNRSK